VAARSTAWTVFARSNTGIVGSNPTWGMDVCVRLFCLVWSVMQFWETKVRFPSAARLLLGPEDTEDMFLRNVGLSELHSVTTQRTVLLIRLVRFKGLKKLQMTAKWGYNGTRLRLGYIPN
jgi:hypothetical protein